MSRLLHGRGGGARKGEEEAFIHSKAMHGMDAPLTLGATALEGGNAKLPNNDFSLCPCQARSCAARRTSERHESEWHARGEKIFVAFCWVRTVESRLKVVGQNLKA